MEPSPEQMAIAKKDVTEIFNAFAHVGYYDVQIYLEYYGEMYIAQVRRVVHG